MALPLNPQEVSSPRSSPAAGAVQGSPLGLQRIKLDPGPDPHILVPCCTTGSTDCGSVAICHWKWHESLWNVGCVFFAQFEPLHEIHEQCNHGPSQTSKTVQACRFACLEVVDASLQINLSAGHQVANGLTVPKLFWRHVGWRSNLLELSTSQEVYPTWGAKSRMYTKPSRSQNWWEMSRATTWECNGSK